MTARTPPASPGSSGHCGSPFRLSRAIVLCSLLALGNALAGPPPAAQPPPLVQVGAPDAAQSARILDHFRRSNWLGYVEFNLDSLPRRGDATVYRGRLWGGRSGGGAVTRIEITDAKGTEHRLLLQNGDHAGVWALTPSHEVRKIDASALLQPIIPEVEITPFDLQMPYLYWPDVKAVAVTRVRGRPAYLFVFRPDLAFAARHPQVAAVRAYFDAEFDAPLRTELLGPGGVVKTSWLVDLKRVGNKWIPKSFDVRDDRTRDKTRFEVKGAALDMGFPSNVFAPAALAQKVPPPPAGRIVKIE